MAALCLLLGALAIARPAAGASPFEGLYGLEAVMTSNDEYGIWAYWKPSSWRLEFPGRAPLAGEAAGSPALRASLRVACRADGRREGYSGPQPLEAVLFLPLHPDEPDVPGFFNPWYWILALTVGERATTPVRVAFGGRRAFSSTLVRPRVDWSFARPDQSVALDPGEALRAIASAGGSTLVAEGPGTRLELRFEPDPELAAVARLMALHCAGLRSPVR